MKIALTGGIGSGKTTVLNILNSLGEKTISFDDVYKSLLSDEKFVEGVYSSIGANPEFDNGKIVFNPEAISGRVFESKDNLKKLNDYTHGKIFEKAFNLGKPFEEKCGRVFYEVPLLFEGNYQNRFDKVWVVLRDLGARVSAAAMRDGLSEKDIKKRVKNQFDYESSDLSLHTLIVNDGDEKSLAVKVENALNELKSFKIEKQN